MKRPFTRANPIPYTNDFTTPIGAGFTPASLSGLIQWHELSVSGGIDQIVIAGSQISTWKDLSGNGKDRFQSTVAERPDYDTINNLVDWTTNYTHFSQTDDDLLTENATLAFRIETSSDIASAQAFYIGQLAFNNRIFIGLSNSLWFYIDDINDASEVVSFSGIAASTFFNYIVTIASNGDKFFYVDNVLGSSNLGGGNLSAMAGGTSSIGGRVDLDTLDFFGKQNFFCQYNRVLSPGELTALNSYMSAI